MCPWETGWGASSGPVGPLEPAHRAPVHPGEAREVLGGERTGVSVMQCDAFNKCTKMAHTTMHRNAHIQERG